MDTDSDAQSSVTKFLIDKSARAKFPFLHCTYLTAFPHKREKWLHWLRKFFNLSTLPRLAFPPLGSSFVLSDDFKFIFKKCPSSEVLLLLRDNWSHYSKWIEEDRTQDTKSESNRSRSGVRKELALMEVKCHDGIYHPLGETSLPGIESDMDISSHLPILKVPKRENRKWVMFQSLGVAVDESLRFYLLCLVSMKGSEVPMEKVSYVYQRIQAMSTANSSLG
jgi:hypothetical protein